MYFTLQLQYGNIKPSKGSPAGPQETVDLSEKKVRYCYEKDFR